MAAYYGAHHSGVCLCFDRTQLVEQFATQLGSRGQWFSGAVRYPVERFSTLPVAAIDIGQVLEFGTDAVVCHYVENHHQELFFTKHHVWANESEFPLILNEPSLMPDYLDVSDCLTGVLLGDAFPAARLEAVRHVLGDRPAVELSQLRYMNGRLVQVLIPSVVETPPVRARRVGTLASRLQELRTLELQRDQAREQGAILIAGISARIATSLSAVKAGAERWDSVEAAVHRHIHAVPPQQRGRRPGVPGEVVEYERGWMCVVENLPKHSYTLIVAAATQLLEDRTLRLHAMISIETWSAEGNSTSEVWRLSRETSIDLAAQQCR